MVARRPWGEIRAYPAALNHHERQILAWSVIPAPLPHRVTADADEIARGIAEGLALEGILAVEMFLLANGTLLVNELAPRPHNSYHETEVACSTSQFEQIVRAVCDLPLGDPTRAAARRDLQFVRRALAERPAAVRVRVGASRASDFIYTASAERAPVERWVTCPPSAALPRTRSSAFAPPPSPLARWRDARSVPRS